MYDYMNMKIFGVVVIIITIIVAGVIYQIQSEEQKQSKLDLFFEKSQIELEEKQNSDDVYVYPPEFFELFHVYVHKNQLRVNSDETQSPEILNFIPKMELKQTF